MIGNLTENKIYFHMTSKDQSSQIPLIKYLRQNSAFSRRLLKRSDGRVRVNQSTIFDSQMLVSQMIK